MTNTKNNTLSIGKIPFAKSVVAGIIIGICLLTIALPQATNADFPNISKTPFADPKVVKTIKVIITAYSSTPDQTDSTPFITASGKYVQDGIVANNLLPFGTKIKIPDLYGDKIFVVEDRMNQDRGKYHVDIWMASTPLAVDFGAKLANIEVLAN